MANGATTTIVPRAATVAGALICLVVMLAMFSEPPGARHPLSFSAGAEEQVAGNDRGFHFTAENVLGLVVIGLISSTFGGMLAMGGGVLKVSLLLLLFGFHPGISKFAALLAYFVVAVGAAYRYHKLGLVNVEAVKILIPSSILGIIVGAIIGHRLPRDAMMILLGMFLLFIAVAMARRMLGRHRDAPTPTDGPTRDHVTGASPGPGASTMSTRPFGRQWLAKVGWKVGLCGFPGGLLSAMLGISGGVVTTPLQQVLAQIPIKSAVANTLVKASVTVPIACVIIIVMGVRAGHFDLWTPVMVAFCLIPGSIVGSQLGPALTKRMPSAVMHALLGAVALVMGVNLLFLGN
jgi:uncharacterized membrane protein YfcA